ncbi:MAG: replicative DNA helicase [Ruthenibacterium lactatiformans]
MDAVTVVSGWGTASGHIRECACIAPRIGTFPQYAAIVLDAWRERTLVTELQSLAISGRTADEMTAELERMAARQRSIMQKVHSASEQTFGEAVAQAYRDLLKPDTSLKTDWKHFNDVLGGLQRGCLYIIAARPGDGKTDFALHLAMQLAKRCRVDYRSLEMTKEQLVHRVLSRVCMINSTRFRDHDLDENAQKRIGIAAARMGDLHLVMDDTPGVSAGDVEAKLASGKPDVMFIDYLGLMRGDAAGNKPLWQITGEITHALKESARRHGAAVVALVQLARAADRQKEPALSDLKGGSDIEADADGVIFMRPQKQVRRGRRMARGSGDCEKPARRGGQAAVQLAAAVPQLRSHRQHKAVSG